jgi:hypothetical protein
VTFKGAELLHGADVKDAHGLVSGGAGDHVSVWGPGEGLDSIFVLVSGQQRDALRRGLLDMATAVRTR